ncbi:hypothetical protein LZ009_18075 [Ramlibacter sp. XY19]|uniref:hypothetical protein n=1 Tax=Ramlibacter paludis TaxID=2908000 RepID=UPI0023D99760|nr:hypothetical protein [Ramlibacter paludis]MCG2594690.1 hypothetical protein [Ramlibacter paludis]
MFQKSAIILLMGLSLALAASGQEKPPSDGSLLPFTDDTEGPLDPSCLTQIQGLPAPGLDARRGLAGGVERNLPTGRVLVRLTFAAADKAPEAQIVFDGGNAVLRDFVKKEVDDYRMPCLKPGDQPIKAVRLFVYPGSEPMRRLTQELSLVDVLKITRDLKAQSVRFDLNEMGCPFKIKFAPWQPYAPNAVREIGASDPRRASFLKWLRELPLNLPEQLMRTAAGEVSTVSVPCAVLDLT